MNLTLEEVGGIYVAYVNEVQDQIERQPDVISVFFDHLQVQQTRVESLAGPRPSREALCSLASACELSPFRVKVLARERVKGI